MVSNYFYAAVHPSAARVSIDRYRYSLMKTIQICELPAWPSAWTYTDNGMKRSVAGATQGAATENPGGWESRRGFT